METTQPSANPFVPRTAPRNARALLHQSRRLVREANLLVDNTAVTARGARTLLLRQVQRRPYATLGAVAAVGYVLAGGLSAALTRVALRAGLRVAAATVLARVLDQLDKEDV